MLLTHDILHRVVFTNGQRTTTMIAAWFLGGVCAGVSPNWWTYEHGLHHMYPNVVAVDGQIGTDPVMFPDSKMFWHSSSFLKHYLIKVQTYLYFPLCLLFGRPNLHYISVILSTEPLRDLSAIALYLTWSITYFVYLPLSSSERWILWWIANCTVGLLHL